MISAMPLFFIAACVTAYAGCGITTFKRVWEVYSIFQIVGLVLLAIVGLGNYFHWHHLYHWADDAGVEVGPNIEGQVSSS